MIWQAITAAVVWLSIPLTAWAFYKRENVQDEGLGCVIIWGMAAAAAFATALIFGANR